MTSGAPRLFATPGTAQALTRARSVAILIGSYDGSGNFGDIAQLDAALALLGRFENSLVVLPVLERANLSGHRALSQAALHPPTHALFLDGGDASDDGLVPAPAPVDLIFAAWYLYGGGYLNPWWGERKLAMLRSTEALLGVGDGGVCRIASGLQVDAAWVAGLGSEDAERLRSFELLGVRDPLSKTAFASLGEYGRVLETADDAIAVLGRWSATPSPQPANGGLQVNLHLVDHEWVSRRPDALLDFYVGLVDELGRIADGPIVVYPLIAYEDEVTTDRPATARLTEACSARGIEVGTPRVLRPATLADAVVELRRAALTVSCSYHVALTSLSLAIPTLLVGDNPYYEQKIVGLEEAFDLPETLGTAASRDPRAAAREIACIIFDSDRREDLVRRLAAGSAKLRRRRAEAEAELLARLGAAAMNALNARVGEVAERLRQRSAEPAELLAQLSRLRSEHAALLHSARTPGAPLDARQALEESRAMLAAEREATAAEAAGRFAAEQRARDWEQVARDWQQELAVVLGSRSWAITSPLRTGAAFLRRERHH